MSEFVRLKLRQLLETINHPVTPGEAQLCKQIEQWIQDNLPLHAHRSGYDVAIDIWHELLRAWDFTEPAIEHVGGFGSTFIQPILDGEPIPIVDDRQAKIYLYWFPHTQTYQCIVDVLMNRPPIHFRMTRWQGKL